MFAILVMILFLKDGTKQVMAEVMPAQPTADLSGKACEAKANKYANDFHGRMDESIAGLGFRCDVLDDPTVRKTGA